MKTLHTAPPVIMWFRADLRLADNPALLSAAATQAPVIPVFVLDDVNSGEWKNGGATNWWLHKSLSELSKRIPLVILRGNPLIEIPKLAQEENAQGVFWNRCYEPWAMERDTHIKKILKDADINAESFNGSLLFEPWEVKNKSGNAYKVFTPYSLECFSRPIRSPDLDIPDFNWKVLPDAGGLDALGLLPKIKWSAGMEEAWQPGEAGAREKLEKAAEEIVADYPATRDYPSVDGTSQLSPHLHFGEISPHTAWHIVSSAFAENTAACRPFLRQLIWREFSWYLLYHFQTLPDKPWNAKFANFSWGNDEKMLSAWQRGKTGYPIVDAGMRQLWETGWMHNRVRMIVGSFLVKHLQIDWRLGEKWFWDTLVDADLGNNASGWQWIAGCGADAAPYFRIFNPTLQSQKFDAQGAYIRRFVPELSALPDKYIHEPSKAPEDILKKADVKLGVTYPKPIVDHSEARKKALEEYASQQGKIAAEAD